MKKVYYILFLVLFFSSCNFKKKDFFNENKLNLLIKTELDFDMDKYVNRLNKELILDSKIRDSILNDYIEYANDNVIYQILGDLKDVNGVNVRKLNIDRLSLKLLNYYSSTINVQNCFEKADCEYKRKTIKIIKDLNKPQSDFSPITFFPHHVLDLRMKEMISDSEFSELLVFTYLLINVKY